MCMTDGRTPSKCRPTEGRASIIVGSSISMGAGSSAADVGFEVINLDKRITV